MYDVISGLQLHCTDTVDLVDPTEPGQYSGLAMASDSDNSAYWQVLITNSSGDARKLWNTLSAAMGRNRGRSPVQTDLSVDAFSKFFNDQVGDVRSSTVGAASPEYGRGRTDVRTNGRTDGRKDGRKDGRTDERTDVYRRTGRRTDGWFEYSVV